MKQKKTSHEGNTTKGGSTYTTPKKPYPRRSGSGSAIFTPEKNRERLQERQLIENLRQLGYTKDPDAGGFPCWCGKNNGFPVWLLSAGKSRGAHFFCLACTERRPTGEYEKIAQDHARLNGLGKVINFELAKLLKEK